MNTSTHISGAERLGGALGRLWKKWLRLDDKICNGLATYGVPVVLTKIALWAIKLIALGALLYYAAFWTALIVAIAAFVCSLDSAHDDTAGLTEYLDFMEEEGKREWREGHSGFGLYDKREWRYDIGDPYEQ